jgi:hypothetical protein
MYSTSYWCYVVMKLEYFDIFSSNNHKANLIKIRQWEPRCSMRTEGETNRQTDRQTDRQRETDRHDEDKFAFRNFLEAPNDLVFSGKLQEVYKRWCTLSGLVVGGWYLTLLTGLPHVPNNSLQSCRLQQSAHCGLYDKMFRIWILNFLHNITLAMTE